VADTSPLSFARPGVAPADPASAARHPWNEGFAWRTHDGPYEIVTPAQARAYDDLGYVLLEDVFDAATLARARAEIEPHERAVNDLLRAVEGGRISVAAADALTVTLHLVLQSAFLGELCAGPVLAGVAHDLLGPDVRLYWDQAVYKLPRNPDPVPWHQDNGYTYVEPQAYLTCWVPLVDATLENGCVWVVPGLHRLGTLAHEHTELGYRCLPDAVEGAVAVPAPAGSIVAFSSLTPHWTGPNRTDEARSAYIVQYAPDGAEALRGEPPGPPTGRERMDDPRRQYPVVVAGLRIGPPASG
jgi:phytanoyl-CoA hydroxylase